MAFVRVAPRTPLYEEFLGFFWQARRQLENVTPDKNGLQSTTLNGRRFIQLNASAPSTQLERCIRHFSNPDRELRLDIKYLDICFHRAAPINGLAIYQENWNGCAGWTFDTVEIPDFFGQYDYERVLIVGDVDGDGIGDLGIFGAGFYPEFFYLDTVERSEKGVHSLFHNQTVSLEPFPTSMPEGTVRISNSLPDVRVNSRVEYNNSTYRVSSIATIEYSDGNAELSFYLVPLEGGNGISVGVNDLFFEGSADLSTPPSNTPR